MTETPTILPTVTEGDLAALLATADRRTLAALVTHLADDPDVVRDLRDRERLVAKAVEVLTPYVRGERTVQPPSDDTLYAAMRIAAGEDVPDEYAPLAREQMGFGPVPPLEPLDPVPGFSVIIVGAGVSGILTGIVFDQMGLSNWTMLEQADGPGGVWRQNTYPGCRVDTPSLMYSYSFTLDHPWPDHFSPQPALLDYVEQVVESSRFGDRLQCGTTVETMTWDEDAQLWHVDVRRRDGTAERLSANFVIGALGLLRVPRYPDIEGRESFAGPAFHSSRWDHSVDLAGKRVAVIGAGASANQIVPAIAPTVEQLVVYQRVPHWMISHPQYGLSISGDEQLLVREIPGYLNWYRFRQFWVLGDRSHALLQLDPHWPHPERAANASSDRFRAELTAYIESELAGREDLVDKVLPDYPVFGKRMLLDNGWYRALRRDNVKLVTGPIRSISPGGIDSAEGFDAVDVIVYATGFETDRFLSPIQVNGTAGADIRAQLDEQPEAYLGMAIENCPNLLVSPGPNGVPGHGGSGIFFAECQVRFMVELLRIMFDEGRSRVEVTPEAVSTFVEDILTELDSMVWGHSEVSNWFRGSRDRVTAILPKRIVDLWHGTREVDRSAFVWS